MSDYIIQRALADVWCTPIMDSQVRIRMTAATPKQGVRGRFKTSLYQYELPDTTHQWHVFKLGRLYIQRFGISLSKLTWYRLSTMGNRNNVLIEVFSETGLVCPRDDVFLMQSDNDGIYLAIRETPKTFYIVKESPLYLRFYDNAYFRSERSEGELRSFEVTVVPNSTPVQRAQAIALFTALKGRVGFVYALINGMFTTAVNALTLTLGDYVEFVYDSSVKLTVAIPISGLQTFHSERDNKTKYLVHHPSLNTGIIEYHDDIDIYVVKPHSTGVAGYKFPKTEVFSQRNVTHCDYSVAADQVTFLTIAQPYLGAAENCHLFLIVRNSGYARPLVNEAQHIHELKKLPYQENVDAMLGIDSNVDVWRAENLEKSEYVKVMNSAYGNLEKDTVTKMYGYDGLATLIAQTPQNVPASPRTVSLPAGLAKYCTVYEYTANGRLIDFYQHINANNYIVRNANCAFVEAIMGLGSDTLAQEVDIVSGNYNPAVNTRFYFCPKISGVPTNNFVEATNQVNISADSYTWMISPTANRLLVRYEDRFLAKRQTAYVQNGSLKFRITSREVVVGINFNSDVAIPTLRLDLWIKSGAEQNSFKLIEGIDYFVKWPEVYIVNKTYVDPIGPNEITIRAYGLSNNNEMRDIPQDKGFVKYGKLSRNSKYDIHDGRVLHIAVAGRVRRRSDIRTEEESDDLFVNDALNGWPYCISEIFPVLGDFSTIKTMDLKDLGRDDVEQISAYMTNRLPETPTDDPSFIAARYPLISVFINVILEEMRNGSISEAFVNSEPSTHQIIQELQEYEEILYFDPTQDANNFTEDNIQILAHYSSTPIPVTFHQYQVLDKVNKHYLFSRVDLSRSYTIA